MGVAQKVCMLCGKPYGTVEASNLKAGDVSHGICPTCAPGYMEREMNELRAARGKPPLQPTELARALAGEKIG